jgi:hypothetical protein
MCLETISHNFLDGKRLTNTTESNKWIVVCLKYILACARIIKACHEKQVILCRFWIQSRDPPNGIKKIKDSA